MFAIYNINKHMQLKVLSILKHFSLNCDLISKNYYLQKENIKVEGRKRSQKHVFFHLGKFMNINKRKKRSPCQ